MPRAKCSYEKALTTEPLKIMLEFVGISYLSMFFHRLIQFLRQVASTVRHVGLLAVLLRHLTLAGLLVAATFLSFLLSFALITTKHANRVMSETVKSRRILSAIKNRIFLEKDGIKTKTFPWAEERKAMSAQRSVPRWWKLTSGPSTTSVVRSASSAAAASAASRFLFSSSSWSSSLMLSSNTFGQKSPSKYGISAALWMFSSIASFRISCKTERFSEWTTSIDWNKSTFSISPAWGSTKMLCCTDLVINHHSFNDGFIKHFLVPVLQPFWLGNFLFWWMTMEDVVVPFAWWTGPNVSHCVSAKCKTEGQVLPEFFLSFFFFCMWEKALAIIACCSEQHYNVENLPQWLGVVKIADENFVIHSCPEVTWFEEVHTVQVSYVHASENRNSQDKILPKLPQMWTTNNVHALQIWKDKRPTLCLAESSQTHILAHAYQKSIHQHHLFLQRQTWLWLGRGKMLAFHCCPQIWKYKI